MSEVGMQRGDPLGPMGFCTSTQKTIQGIETNYSQWYLDDGALSGQVGELIQAFQFIKAQGTTIGLLVNECECKLLTNDVSAIERFRSFAPGVTAMDPAMATLLGAPVSEEQTVDFVLGKKLTELDRASEQQTEALQCARCFLSPAELFQSAETTIYFALLTLFQQFSDSPLRQMYS